MKIKIGRRGKPGTRRAEIKENGDTVSSDCAELDLPRKLRVKPDETVFSKVGVTIGYKKSRNYQSVGVDVSVEVPVPVGKEVDGINYAAEQADFWIRAHESDLDSFLDRL